MSQKINSNWGFTDINPGIKKTPQPYQNSRHYKNQRKRPEESLTISKNDFKRQKHK